jgi:hypothetical protein
MAKDIPTAISTRALRTITAITAWLGDGGEEEDESDGGGADAGTGSGSDTGSGWLRARLLGDGVVVPLVRACGNLVYAYQNHHHNHHHQQQQQQHNQHQPAPVQQHSSNGISVGSVTPLSSATTAITVPTSSDVGGGCSGVDSSNPKPKPNTWAHVLKADSATPPVVHVAKALALLSQRDDAINPMLQVWYHYYILMQCR